jgi:microcystin-dependent protein
MWDFPAACDDVLGDDVMKLLALYAASTLALTASNAGATAYVTDPAGGGQPFNNYQPSLVLTQSIGIQGIFPPRGGGGTSNGFIGMMHTFAGNFGPFGAPPALGQLLPISQNTALFSILGTTYGGDGKVTFALPNLIGQSVIGAGQGPGLEHFSLGQTAGSATVTLTEAQMPAHDHDYAPGMPTSPTGSNQPFDNYQPSLALNYMIAADGLFPSQDSGGGHTLIGEIGVFAGTFEPGGWLFADGRLLDIATYDTLFQVIGTTYGGDGQTTFALPDLRGRTIVGTGQGPGLEMVDLGEVLGTPEVTLTQSQMPSHDHGLPTGGTTDITGGNQPFDQHEPSLGLNYIIALQGVFPPRDGSGAVPDDVPYMGEIVAFAGGFAPKGWALAQGQLLSIAQNQALFSILGTMYGGNGQTTFALPDLRGRTILGSGFNQFGTFNVGDKIGSSYTTLSLNELPSHTHGYELAGAPGVPEPATWAMMIGGFALVGASMRRRKLAVAFG